jgi:hypothetical protein
MPEYNEETIKLGKVRYINYRSDVMNDKSMLGRFFYKRKSFSYENELRATSVRIVVAVDKESTSPVGANTHYHNISVPGVGLNRPEGSIYRSWTSINSVTWVGSQYFLILDITGSDPGFTVFRPWLPGCFCF